MTGDIMPYFNEKDITTLPGWVYIGRALGEMELSLGKKLPDNFPVSLWVSTLLINEDVRKELVLPEDPIKEASYLLIFGRQESYRLENSLMMRITQRPQSFYGMLEHPKVDSIIDDLRAVYDGKLFKRVARCLSLPTLDWAWNFHLPGKEHARTFHVIRPDEQTNLAGDFERIFEKYDAVEYMEEKGFNDLYSKVYDELLTIETLS